MCNDNKMKSFERSGARWVERRTRPQPPEDTAHPANMYIRVRWRRGGPARLLACTERLTSTPGLQNDMVQSGT